MLTLFGAMHGLGGLAGYDARKTDDEDPNRLGVTQRMEWAYLWAALSPGDAAWRNGCAALGNEAAELGKVDSE